MNAIKYTPSNTDVVISAKNNGNELIIGVSDQGKGVDEELKSKLFVESVQSQKGTAGELGHGLGLSLAADFIKRQNGFIGLDQEYKDGAKFIIKLPLAK